jgi:hypothetical protein
MAVRSPFVINWDMTAGVELGPYDSPYGMAFLGDLATLVANRSKLIVYPEWDDQTNKPRTEGSKYTEFHRVRRGVNIAGRVLPALYPFITWLRPLHLHVYM